MLRLNKLKGAYPSGAPCGANIRLGRKNSPGTNTLAYFATLTQMKSQNKLEFLYLVSLFSLVKNLLVRPETTKIRCSLLGSAPGLGEQK